MHLFIDKDYKFKCTENDKFNDNIYKSTEKHKADCFLLHSTKNFLEHLKKNFFYIIY